MRASLLRTVVHRFQITDLLGFPRRCIAFGYSAAAFRKPGVADGAVVTEELAGGGSNRIGCLRRKGFGDALITLAVIVGADVEVRMRFAAVPAEDFTSMGTLLRPGSPFLRLRPNGLA